MTARTMAIALGIAAALTLVAVMAYSARRSVPARRTLGPTRKYLLLHLWGGLAFFVLFLFHSSFRLPSSGLMFVVWTLSLWVVLTGAVGWLLQRTLPRILAPTATFEVNFQRIPEFVQELRTRAETLVSTAEQRTREYYTQRIAPDMVAPRMITALLMQKHVARPGRGEFDLLARTLQPDELATLHMLRGLQATKKEIDVQYTIQRILRGWLYFHLPAAVALLALVVVHAFLVVYF